MKHGSGSVQIDRDDLAVVLREFLVTIESDYTGSRGQLLAGMDRVKPLVDRLLAEVEEG